MWTSLWQEISGCSLRRDEIAPRSGGAAGNSRLTAWTGLTLLVLVVAELLTLLDTSGLIHWHIAIGAALIPYALLKSASTTWRMAGYYARRRPYRQAGPPPKALRVLGPFVILSTLAVLTSGVVLVVRGESSSHRAFFSGFGHDVDWILLHQVCFLAFTFTTGLHLVCRVMLALLLVSGHHGGRGSQPVPGRALRSGVWLLAAGAAFLTAVLLLHVDGGWGASETETARHPSSARSAVPMVAREDGGNVLV